MSKNNQDDLYSQTNRNLDIVGWREIAALPRLNIARIKAKIDTGARSSSLHAFDIEELSQNNKTIIRFQVHPLQKNNDVTIIAEAPLIEYREIKNSGGTVELRPVVKTEIALRKETWEIELTLTNRELMGFRMLIGREAVRNKFLVDPGKSYLQSDQKDKNKK